jgi:pimeloyl-ACP methyl ester carboxylesterase
MFRILALSAALCAVTFAQSLKDLDFPGNLNPGDPIVIGMLGGFERWNDEHRGVRKLVLKLRDVPGAHAESFANRSRRLALKYILRALDTDRNRKLDVQEKQRANVVLFGQSLGGAQVVALARDLNRRGVPVQLTVQVDSFGLRDAVIPSNVRRAANYFQRELFTLWGVDEIRAADSSKTKILANVQFHYPPFLPSYSQPESWPRRKLGGAHAKLEADPILWAQVETMIRQAIAEK